MFRQNDHPKWWQLYLLLPILAGVLLIIFRMPLSANGKEAAELASLFLVYALVFLWIRKNRIKVNEPQVRHKPVIISFVSEAASGNYSPRDLPSPEIKGVLDDTFDVDVIDADFLPIEDSQKEWKEMEE